jgi:cobalt-zinc-cadmium efflux system protein
MSGQHDHTHAPAGERRLLWALLLTGGFMIAEVIGGMISGSLALLADAGHMLTDTASLFIAWFAARLSRRPADTIRSYGYHRMQILAAFFNGIAFIAMVVWIVVEAIQRLLQPVEVLGDVMLAVAVMGLLVNVVAFLILHGGARENLNLRAATIHVMGDLLGSLAAISAAAIILVSGWMPIDPLLSVLVAALILRSAWYVVRESAHILLEGTPEDVDARELRRALIEAVPQVNDVHHIHIWSLTPERPLLTMHVNVDGTTGYSDVLQHIKQVLIEHFNIHHSTIQIEVERCADEAHPL